VAKPLTLPEARTLIEATATDRLGPLWRLALVTGMRSGELRGLSWDAVGDGWVEVREQLVRRPHSQGGDRNGWGSAKPKVQRAVDRIAVDAATSAALEAHRRRMASERQADWEYDRLVFLTTEGRPFHSANLLDAFAAACKAAGLGTRRLHDLRHTNLRLLHDLGVPEDVRMARAGHEQKATQRGYAGASKEQDRVAAEGLGRALTG
jgi:integrase